MRIKEHLINKPQDNKYSIITHRIIFLVLLILLIYEFTFDNILEKMNYINLNQINLYLNIFYYFLCCIGDLCKKDTKKSYQIFFHFCFSISSSLPFIYLLLIIMHLVYKDFDSNISFISIGIIISPIIFNILETLIIKRYRPSYINPIFLILFLSLYYIAMHFLGKLDIGIDGKYLKYILEIKFLVPICVATIFGTFLGWWIYKVITRPKVKKIDMKDNLDSSELSDE